MKENDSATPDILKRRFVTRRDLEAITGIRKRTWDRYALFDGRGPKFRVLGGRASYDLDEVNRWLESRPVRGGDAA